MTNYFSHADTFTSTGLDWTGLDWIGIDLQSNLIAFSTPFGLPALREFTTLAHEDGLIFPTRARSDWWAVGMMDGWQGDYCVLRALRDESACKRRARVGAVCVLASRMHACNCVWMGACAGGKKRALTGTALPLRLRLADLQTYSKLNEMKSRYLPCSTRAA